jgi:hypothetical protein
MGGSHHKSTALSHQGSEEVTHHLDQLQPKLPDHVLNSIRYKGTSLSKSDIQRISDILIQKCKDTIKDSDTFKNHNLNGDRVFKDVHQYL